jgi:hypothetical protein
VEPVITAQRSATVINWGNADGRGVDVHGPSGVPYRGDDAREHRQKNVN